MGGNNGTVDALAMSKPVQDMVRPHLVDIHPYDPVDPPDVLAKRTGCPRRGSSSSMRTRTPTAVRPR